MGRRSAKKRSRRPGKRAAKDKSVTLVVGLGEVGSALAELLSPHYRVVSVDLESVPCTWPVGVMHICYPYHDEFVRTTVDYINKYKPALTVINSTVLPGTTRSVALASGVPVVNSPVRGKHFRMVKDMVRYPKWFGGLEPAAVRRARSHFSAVGMQIRVASSPEAVELAKLLETTYFGLCIAWAQEVERFGRQVDVPYKEIDRFFAEIPYFQCRYFPGFIGGHCVIPNVHFLKRIFHSPFLDAILDSNERKRVELGGVIESAREGKVRVQ